METNKLPIPRATLAELIARHEAGTLVGAFYTTHEDYHAAPGLSKSSLDKIAVCPALFKWHLDHPEPETEAMKTGRILHTAVLEPEEFPNRYVVAGEEFDKKGAKNTNAWKALRDDVQLQGKELVSNADFDEVQQMVQMARSHGRAALLEGLKEVSFWWKCPTTGLLCKCRPDNITMKAVITDYKSCVSAYPARDWSTAMAAQNYAKQAAFYLDGVRHALDQAGQVGLVPTPEKFVFFCQEKTAPYLCKAWLLGDASIHLGRREYETELKIVSECEASGKWPGYPPEIEPIDLPEWKWKSERESGE